MAQSLAGEIMRRANLMLTVRERIFNDAHEILSTGYPAKWLMRLETGNVDLRRLTKTLDLDLPALAETAYERFFYAAVGEQLEAERAAIDLLKDDIRRVNLPNHDAAEALAIPYGKLEEHAKRVTVGRIFGGIYNRVMHETGEGIYARLHMLGQIEGVASSAANPDIENTFLFKQELYGVLRLTMDTFLSDAGKRLEALTLHKAGVAKRNRRGWEAITQHEAKQKPGAPLKPYDPGNTRYYTKAKRLGLAVRAF